MVAEPLRGGGDLGAVPLPLTSVLASLVVADPPLLARAVSPPATLSSGDRTNARPSVPDSAPPSALLSLPLGLSLVAAGGPASELSIAAARNARPALVVRAGLVCAGEGGAGTGGALVDDVAASVAVTLTARLAGAAVAPEGAAASAAAGGGSGGGGGARSGS